MRVSSEGLALIQGFESLQLAAYQDVGGVWTIGWGHTRGVRKGDTCTRAQADLWLKQDVMDAEEGVTALVKVGLAQSEFDALVSFHFNTGALGRSTLLRRLNSGDRAGAANEFLRWVYDNGVKYAGLVRRRAAERALFLRASSSPPEAPNTDRSGTRS